MTFNHAPRASTDQVEVHGLDETAVDTLRSIYENLFDPSETISLVGLKPHERFCALRNNALMRKIAIIRQNKHDCAFVIYDLIAALSDNQYGRATVSIPCIAEVINRSVPRTEEAIRKLVRLGLIERASEPGKGAHTSLVISRACTDLKPNEIVKLLAPKRYRGLKAPSASEGGGHLTPRGKRGEEGVKPPSSNVGGNKDTPLADPHNPPRHVGEPPSPEFNQRVEIAREAEHNTAILNTAKKNSADYVDAASSTSRLRELDVGEFLRRFTAEDQCRPLLPWWEEIDQASLHSALIAGARLAETVPNIVAGLIALFPRAPARALAHAVREEISFREHCIQKLRDALVILEALPRDLLPALSEAGRELKVGDELVRMLQAGRTLEAVLRARAEAVYLEGLRRAWSIDKGRELTNADVRQLPLGGSQMRLPAPPWPKSEAQLTTYIDRVEAEVQPAARRHTLGQLRGAWDYEREDAGLALSFELPPAHREELERRLNHWIEVDGSWDDMQPIYWPLIAPSPELEECVDD